MKGKVFMNHTKIKSYELIGKRVAIGQITFTSIKTYHMLKKEGVDVAMFFDRDYRLQHIKYRNTPIFPWSNFHDTYVILTISSRYSELKKNANRVVRIFRRQDYIIGRHFI